MATITRQIHFFRAVLDSENGQLPDWGRLASLIANLPEDGVSPYVTFREGYSLRVFPDLASGGRHCFRIGLKRTRALPSKEVDGRVRVIPMEAREGLLEESHIIIFPRDIVAVEYNHFGPRAPRFPYFCYVRFPREWERFSLRPMVDRNAVRKLRSLESVRAVNLRLSTSNPEAVEPVSPNLALAVADMAEQGAELFEMRIQPNLYSRERVDWDPNLVRNILDRLDPEPGNVLKVHGFNSRTLKDEEFDFLADRIASKKNVEGSVDEESRRVDSNSMYDAMSQAYQENLETLNEALEAEIEVIDDENDRA